MKEAAKNIAAKRTIYRIRTVSASVKKVLGRRRVSSKHQNCLFLRNQL